MLRRRHAIDEAEILSDEELGSICAPVGSSDLTDFSTRLGQTPAVASLAAGGCSVSKAAGSRFLCCSPRVVPFTRNRMSNGRLEVESAF